MVFIMTFVSEKIYLNIFVPIWWLLPFLSHTLPFSPMHTTLPLSFWNNNVNIIISKNKIINLPHFVYWSQIKNNKICGVHFKQNWQKKIRGYFDFDLHILYNRQIKMWENNKNQVWQKCANQNDRVACVDV